MFLWNIPFSRRQAESIHLLLCINGLFMIETPWISNQYKQGLSIDAHPSALQPVFWGRKWRSLGATRLEWKAKGMPTRGSAPAGVLIYKEDPPRHNIVQYSSVVVKDLTSRRSSPNRYMFTSLWSSHTWKSCSSLTHIYTHTYRHTQHKPKWHSEILYALWFYSVFGIIGKE
jgi:hypothetical protein